MSSDTDTVVFTDTNKKNNGIVDKTLSSIEAKLVSEKDDVVNKALDGFNSLLDEYDECIPYNIFKWTKRNSNEIIRASLIEKLRQQITRIIECRELNFLTVIPKSETDLDREYVVQIFMEAVNPLSDEITKQLLCEIVIPNIFEYSLKDSEAHNVIIDFGFSLITKFPISKLSSEEALLFTSQLIKRELKVLERFTEENCSCWHELWVFVVRFSAKVLHTSMELANKLLRIAECAFRSPSFEQRLLGYDCWKELIDNRSLDMRLMCSSKQIKLLIAPLRAKFFKTDVVICKRFEIFLYLLEKLQDNSVLCLNDFLEFCFGVSNPKNGQVKLVPNLRLKCVQVFLALLGDQKCDILSEVNRDLFKKAIIDEYNIESFFGAVVFSVIECSKLLNKVSLNIPEKIDLLKSLWTLLFDILNKSSREVQEKCFQTVFNSLDVLFKDFNEDVAHMGLMSAFAELLESSIDYSIYNDSLKIVLQHSMNFLNEGTVSDCLEAQFKTISVKLCQDKNTFQFATQQLKKLEPSKNEEIVLEIWKDLGLRIIEHKDNSKSIFSIVLWPVHHLSKCTNSVNDVCTKWTELFLLISNPEKILIIKEIEKAFKTNPLLSSNISILISSLYKDDIILEKEMVDSLVKLMASIMFLPLLSQGTAEKLFPLIIKCTNFVVENEIELEIGENIVHCLQKIPDHQKNLSLLETVESLAKKMIPHANTNVGKKLKAFIETFSNTKLQKKALKISNLLSPEVNTTPSIKRSVRMTQMVFDKEGSTPKKGKVESLQLFGKDVETLTPLKVKGSILQNTPSSSSSRSKKIISCLKKPTPATPIDDEKTSEFAVIDTEVKFQKNLLTDHQKEKLRERREDIPALYQDLSQSQTQNSLSIDNQSSQIPNIVNENKNNDKTNSHEGELMDCEKLEITMEEKQVAKNEENLKKQSENDSNTDSDEIEKNKKAISKSQRELMKIQMDIVGGNSFIHNLPSKRSRKANDKTTVTPKRVKKLETETTKSKSSVENVADEGNKTEEEVELKENSPTTVKPEVVAVASENSSSINNDSTLIKSPTTSNKRKGSKPIKNFISPSTQKKKRISSHKKEISSIELKKKLSKEINKMNEDPLEAQLSENLFDSEINGVVKDKSNKKEKTANQENKNKIELLDQIPNNDVNKPKKSPKEFMKKNKEKVRAIQNQLRLANLSNLESSENTKSRKPKLLVLRQLTNSKNSQDTKVSSVSLKRNKDNKSNNIAYTIEAPTVNTSLVNIDDLQPSCSKIEDLKELEMEKIKPSKRKRTSDSSNSVDTNSPPSDKSSSKTRKTKPRSDVKNRDSKQNSAEIKADNVENSDEKISKNGRKADMEISKENKKENSSSSGSPSRTTRSRTNSPKNINVSPQKQVSPKGVRALLKDSEDIIESSQGSFVENTSFSKSRITRSPKLYIGAEKSETSEEVDSVSQICENPESPNSKSEKSISQATTLTCESTYEAQPSVVQVDTLEKQELSDSEKLLSMADTVSIVSTATEETIKKNEDNITNCEISENVDTSNPKESDLNRNDATSPITNNPIGLEFIGTPEKSDGNLPSSPVSQATPTFKKELMDNTMDISPIISQTLDNDDKMEKDIIAALDAAIGETSEPEQVTSTSKDSRTTSVLSSNVRSNKLLNMVNVESPVSSQKRVPKRNLTSPGKKSRYEKLFSFYKNSQNGKKGKSEDGLIAGTENEEDILTFSREIPSPLAVPSSGILKRKLSVTDDSYSPCPKRKRVNFSYPCITSTKLFVRHKGELNAHFRASFGANLEDDQEDSEDEDPFTDPESYSENNGSEESMEITNSLSLCSNKPIDERLLNCDDNLDSLWKRLSTSSYCDKLKNLLKSKNIETIGDLASLNEVEINRLPFRDPKVKAVKNALSHYFSNVYDKSKDKEQSENSSTSSEEENEKILNEENERILNEENERILNEENERILNEENESHPQISEVCNGNDKVQSPENLKDEIRIVLTKIKRRDTSLEEFGELFIDLVEESELINLLENVYNTNFRKFFGKPHWRYLVENIVKSGGTSELFDIISDLAENNKVFANQLEHIVQLRIDQDPLKNILKKKTLVQVGLALRECIEEEEFRKENVIQQCFMPLIKSPSDIMNYFNSLTIVQIHDLFIERVQPSDLTCFLNMIRDHYGNYTIAQCANKQDVLKMCSKEDLAISLIEKESEVGAVKHLISSINDQDKLLELYKYIGNLLPLRSRIDCHIDMLKSISFDKSIE